VDKRELIERCREHDVKFVRLQFTELYGQLKNISIPATELEKALDNELMFDGSSIRGFKRIEKSDMYFHPDPSTFQVLPWGQERTARLICWATTPDGEPYAGDPRGVLRRAVDEAARLGFEYRVGPEIEFFILERAADGSLAPTRHDRSSYFDFASDGNTDLRQRMVSALISMGIAVNTSHHEIAGGQHEIDIDAAPALKAADDVITFRYALKAVAQQAGAIATFMPKPFDGQPGSGMHVHQSLLQGRDAGNAFAGEDAYGLSEIAQHFIAGQLHHAAGISAVLAPIVNSYKRLVRGFEAPIFISWARTNRGALIRVPHVGRAQATRVELRSPDPSCNPYLAFAVMLRCGLDGIERRLPLPPPVEESLYGFDETELERRNVGILPDNLKDAVDALEADEVVIDALGDHLAERFIAAKRLEWLEYRGQVTPWEINQYLERC